MKLPGLVVFAAAGIAAASGCQSAVGDNRSAGVEAASAASPAPAETSGADATGDTAKSEQQSKRYHYRTVLAPHRVRHRQPFAR